MNSSISDVKIRVEIIEVLLEVQLSDETFRTTAIRSDSLTAHSETALLKLTEDRTNRSQISDNETEK